MSDPIRARLDEWRTEPLLRDVSRYDAALRAVLDAVGDADCPYGFEPYEPGCDCIYCQVRAAIADVLGVTDD